MTAIRAFVAITVDAAIIERLAALQQRLRAAGGPVSWVRPEGMHLTLKFLGNVETARVAEVGDALAAVAARHPAFPVAVAGTGAFPSVRRARVIWAGIEEGAEALRALHAEIEGAFAPLGFPAESRPFHPHLTLGRVREPGNIGPLAALVEEHAHDRFGEMRATHLLLMRSDLAPQGARYTALRREALGAPPCADTTTIA